MRMSRFCLSLAIVALGAAAAGTARAADPSTTTSVPTKAPSGIADRLFLSFAQDAAIVPSQWWEGQIEYDDRAPNFPVNAFIGRAVVAFQPWKNIEIGGRVGLGNTSANDDLPSGTGATDLDAYAKYYFGNALDHTDFTAGLLLTIPTGDDHSGLGFNSFAEQIFGGVRYRLDNALIGGHVGLRLNGNGSFQGVDLTGKTSFELAGNVVIQTTKTVGVVGEIRVETERFDGQDSIVEALAGVNWKAFGRGMIRAALGGGLTDAAPNFRVIASYAYTF